jgi:hypothetical protein
VLDREAQEEAAALAVRRDARDERVDVDRRVQVDGRELVTVGHILDIGCANANLRVDLGYARAVRKRALLVAVALAAFAACNPLASLAYYPVFSGLRPGLVQDCCVCLHENGTRHPGARCGEAFLPETDGGFTFDDAGVSPHAGVSAIPADVDAGPDDADGVIEADEVPCLCDDDLAQCEQKLNGDGGILVTGACISHLDFELIEGAPCASACQGVIDFIPVAAQP